MATCSGFASPVVPSTLQQPQRVDLEFRGHHRPQAGGGVAARKRDLQRAILDSANLMIGDRPRGRIVSATRRPRHCSAGRQRSARRQTERTIHPASVSVGTVRESAGQKSAMPARIRTTHCWRGRGWGASSKANADSCRDGSELPVQLTVSPLHLGRGEAQVKAFCLSPPTSPTAFRRNRRSNDRMKSWKSA